MTFSGSTFDRTTRRKRWRTSERESDADLARTRVRRGGDPTEVGRNEICVRVVQVDVIQHVERIGAKLQSRRLAKREILRQRRVDRPTCGTAHQIRAHGSRSKRRGRGGTRGHQRKRAPVQIEKRLAPVPEDKGDARDVIKAAVWEPRRVWN